MILAAISAYMAAHRLAARDGINTSSMIFLTRMYTIHVYIPLTAAGITFRLPRLNISANPSDPRSAVIICTAICHSSCCYLQINTANANPQAMPAAHSTDSTSITDKHVLHCICQRKSRDQQHDVSYHDLVLMYWKHTPRQSDQHSCDK